MPDSAAANTSPTGPLAAAALDRLFRSAQRFRYRRILSDHRSPIPCAGSVRPGPQGPTSPTVARRACFRALAGRQAVLRDALDEGNIAQSMRRRDGDPAAITPLRQLPQLLSATTRAAVGGKPALIEQPFRNATCRSPT